MVSFVLRLPKNRRNNESCKAKTQHTFSSAILWGKASHNIVMLLGKVQKNIILFASFMGFPTEIFLRNQALFRIQRKKEPNKHANKWTNH